MFVIVCLRGSLSGTPCPAFSTISGDMYPKKPPKKTPLPLSFQQELGHRHGRLRLLCTTLLSMNYWSSS